MNISVALAGLSGACFALIGIAYRLGQSRGLTPVRIAPVMALAGAVFFCAGADALAAAPYWVWLVGASAGAGQYALLGLVRAALARGPLSPVWCAASLNFVGATVYARAVLGETLSWSQLAAVATGVACVLVAGRCEHAADGGRTDHAPGGRAYVAMLLAIFLLNSMPPIAVKHLAALPLDDARTQMDAHGDALYVALYLALLAASLAKTALRGVRAVPVAGLATLGCLAAVGSIAGMACIAACASGSASAVFTVSSSASILVAAVTSVTAFGERPTLAWAGMVALGVATVTLANAP